MPVYEYLCESCGKHQEHIRKFSDEPLVDCELCGAKGTLVKQISRSSFALKGSGWYTTDYKRAGKKDSDSTQSGAATEKSSAGENSTAADKSSAADTSASTATNSPAPSPAPASKETPKPATKSSGASTT